MNNPLWYSWSCLRCGVVGSAKSEEDAFNLVTEHRITCLGYINSHSDFEETNCNWGE